MFFYSFIFACGKNLCCARRKRSSALSDSLCKNECVSVSLDSFYHLSCKVLNSASIKYDDERVLFLFKRLGDWNKIWDRLSVIRSRIPVENNDALCNQASFLLRFPSKLYPAVRKHFHMVDISDKRHIRNTPIYYSIFLPKIRYFICNNLKEFLILLKR